MLMRKSQPCIVTHPHTLKNMLQHLTLTLAVPSKYVGMDAIVLLLLQAAAVQLAGAVRIGRLGGHRGEQQGDVWHRRVTGRAHLALEVLCAHDPGDVAAGPTDENLGPARAPAGARFARPHALLLQLHLPAWNTVAPYSHIRSVALPYK